MTLQKISEVPNTQTTNGRVHYWTSNIAPLPVQTDGIFLSRRRLQWILNVINSNSGYEFTFLSCNVFFLLFLSEVLKVFIHDHSKENLYFFLLKNSFYSQKVHAESTADGIFGLNMCSIHQPKIAGLIKTLVSPTESLLWLLGHFNFVLSTKPKYIGPGDNKIYWN